MKMRFWQKTYIFTLVLFLLCINGGILSLTVYTYQKNVTATETAVSAEQYYAAMSFERDYNDLYENYNNANYTILMQSYGAHYIKKGVFLSFIENGEAVYSNFPFEYSVNSGTLTHTYFESKRHIIVSSVICDGEYELVFAKNVESLDSEFKALMITYALTSAGVSLFLAVCLYFVLKKLSLPLEKLRRVTKDIEAGDFSVTVEESGNDEFALVAKSFNSMLAKINEQLAALELDAERKQMLVDNMAHELRTPLTSIRGYAEYLEKAATTEENRIVAARYIMSESERLQKISEILLDSAFIRGNTPEMVEVEVAEVLGDVASKLKMKAEDHGVIIECNAEKMSVIGNETLLSMLFYNLTDNAIKACSQGGRVELECFGDMVIIKDNGKGITDEQITHITEPFYRTDKSRSRAEGGAGLGLALCKQIVETHDAAMRFESQIGIGTKIFINFTRKQ